jgi:hypothetical protein
VLSTYFSTSKGVSPKIFCCVCLVHIHGPARGKLNPQALKCVFVSYSPTHKGYKCYQPQSRKHCLNGCHFLWNTILFLSIPNSSSRGESHWRGFFTLLPVLTLMPEQEKQQLTNESCIEPTDKSFAPLVEELRVYSRRQKIRPFPMLHAKHLILTLVTLLLFLIWIM